MDIDLKRVEKFILELSDEGFDEDDIYNYDITNNADLSVNYGETIGQSPNLCLSNNNDEREREKEKEKQHALLKEAKISNQHAKNSSTEASWIDKLISDSHCNFKNGDKTVDLNEFITKLLSARVVLKRLPDLPNGKIVNNFVITDSVIIKNSRRNLSKYTNCSKCHKRFKSCNIQNHERDCAETTNELENDKENSPLLIKEESGYTVVDNNPDPNSNKNELLTHIEFYCTGCEERTRIKGRSGITTKLKHICKSCKSSLVWECIKCKSTYTTYQSIRYHLITKCYPRFLYYCKKCNYKTACKAIIKNHLKTHEKYIFKK